MSSPWRVGIGYDLHRLVDGRPLILGGVAIDHPQGLLAHSDGDAVLHAVADALLGAAGLGDIGEHFPDGDPTYKDADSRDLLRQVVEKVRAAGFAPVNVDCIVHAERPRLSPYKQAMTGSIAGILGLDPAAVTVKAKTNEGIGPIGASQAIACMAVALVTRIDDQAK